MKNSTFTPLLARYLENIESEFSHIPENRTGILKEIGKYLDQSLKSSGTADMVFICTHNSRRSQFGQIWAAVAADFYGIEEIHTFSGGTESTAFNLQAMAALKRAGLIVEASRQNPENPEYSVQTGKGSQASIMFSKKYNDPANPSENFCAIMVCSDADEACPIIPGAVKRISLPYEDPKEFDGTPFEKLKYDECCRKVARDFLYVHSLLR